VFRLQVGIKPLVPITQRILRIHRRNSRGSSTLDQGIVYEYDKKDNTGKLGWTNESYYGRFYEHGYRPITGTRKMVGGRLRWLPKSKRRPSGHATIKRPHIKKAYEAEKEHVTNRVLETIKREIKIKYKL